MTSPLPPLSAMSTHSRGASAAPVQLSGRVSDAFSDELSALYALSQDSRHVFASPLGPLSVRGKPAYLPRFVFFGPHASDDSWRVAFLAGLDHRDQRASRTLIALASLLAADSEAGHALNLTFFPMVDVGGLASGTAGRRLASSHWGRGAPPEIALLEKDARQRGYHGFVTVETAPPGDDMIGLRVRGPLADDLSTDLELITSEETGSFPVRFETEGGEGAASSGPLSIADDLPLAPFELTLRIPGSWSDAAYRHAAVTLLERFLRRYRAFQAYGQHL
jgi:hypothetical protein